MEHELRPLSPFKNFCVKFLGYTPSAYDDYEKCLTYLECLIYTYNYLKNEIVPSVNAQNEVVQELEDFVTHYFDNLDVQEEINNKLDDMAESGELTDIIAQYLGLAGVLAYNTVADMKAAENLANGSTCKTLGFYSLNDGGESFYKIREITNDDIIDEATIIALNNNTLIAELIFEKEMNIEQYGAVGDGTTDDFTKFQIALNHGGIIKLGKNKTYKINDYLRMKSNTTIDMNNSVISTSLNRIIYNFLYDDTFTAYNGNGNISIKNGTFNGGCISLIHGENITFENVIFKDTANNHFIELCACKNVFINNCRFINTLTATNKGCINIDPCNYTSFPWLDEENSTYDNTVNDGITICNCFFDGVMRGVDAHAETTYHNKNISVYNNIINATNETSDCDAIQLFACDNVKVYANDLTCYRYGVMFYGDNVSIFNNKVISKRSTISPPVYVYNSSANIYLADNKGYTNTTSRMWNNVVINPNVNDISVSFIRTDPFTNITTSTNPSESKVEINLSFNVTDFNEITLVTGYPTGANAGTLKTTLFKSFYQNNFQATEKYDASMIESGAILHIVNANKIRLENTTQTVRTVLLSKK